MTTGGQDKNHEIETFSQTNDIDTAGRVIAAGEKMVQSVGKIEDVLQNAHLDVAAYQEALVGFSGQIADNDGQAAQTLLAQMLLKTQEMQQQNDLLRAQLEQSSGEISKLRGNLEVVRREAVTDELTKVGNRKYFDVRLREMAQEAELEGENICLLLFDVDHFKAFNDNHGHQTGDQVLRLVAKTLNDGVKGRDTVARYGGEEFAVILSGIELDNAVRVGDEIRKSVAKRRIVRKSTGEEIAKITISAGVAQYRQGEPFDDLIGRCDAALYRAKDAGRNQVMPESDGVAQAVNQ